MPDLPYETQRRAVRQRLLLQMSIAFTALLGLMIALANKSLPIPYHTSALSGQAWVLELLAGHPDRIRCELGVSVEVFHDLITHLQDLGYTRTRYVSLEEQLAIFLYMSVTGLTIRHVGERFQRANETISK